MTEKDSTQIELLRRRLTSAPGPSPTTRRVTFLKGIAKATEASAKNDKTGSDNISRRGWDTDAVEEMWDAVLTYINDMGTLLNDLAGLKDVSNRAIDKASVPPFTTTPILHRANPKYS
jgi:hypothetical protein